MYRRAAYSNSHALFKALLLAAFAIHIYKIGAVETPAAHFWFGRRRNATSLTHAWHSFQLNGPRL
jgi:hypothetical protein